MMSLIWFISLLLLLSLLLFWLAEVMNGRQLQSIVAKLAGMGKNSHHHLSLTNNAMMLSS